MFEKKKIELKNWNLPNKKYIFLIWTNKSQS